MPLNRLFSVFVLIVFERLSKMSRVCALPVHSKDLSGFKNPGGLHLRSFNRTVTIILNPSF